MNIKKDSRNHFNKKKLVANQIDWKKIKIVANTNNKEVINEQSTED